MLTIFADLNEMERDILRVTLYPNNLIAGSLLEPIHVGDTVQIIAEERVTFLARVSSVTLPVIHVKPDFATWSRTNVLVGDFSMHLRPTSTVNAETRSAQALG